MALGSWALEHIDCIRAAQQRYDAAQGKGEQEISMIIELLAGK